MSNDMKEQLSALMDGEIERDAARFALRAAAGDRALAASWSRYHLARDCLKKQPVLLTDSGFAASVMARIDAEDAAAPVGGRWMRYLSGGAVAAAVAVAALIASAPEQEPGRPASGPVVVATPSAPRPAAFNDSLVRSGVPQLAQPASATVGGDTLFAPAYDLRAQPSNGWRPIDPGMAAMRSPNAPYALLLVPVDRHGAADAKAQPRLQ